MCRKENIASQLHQAALNSEMAARHGAIVTKGSCKPICVGFNKSRSKMNSYLMPSTHAEIDVGARVYKYYKQRSSNKKELMRIMSKFTIWVGRILRDDSLSNSEPCSDCCNKLRQMGYNRIGFTNLYGEIVIKRLSEYTNSHLSRAQSEILNL